MSDIAEKLKRSIAKAMDHAGTVPAKSAVKLRPADWNAVIDEGREAAAEITALRASLSAKDEEVKRLREALEPFRRFGELLDLETTGFLDSDTVGIIIGDWTEFDRIEIGEFRRARAALSARTVAMEHIAQELAEEIEEETR